MIFSNRKEIEEIQTLGSGLLLELRLSGQEGLRYDVGMFPEVTIEQNRVLDAFPEFGTKFPQQARVIRASKERAERLSSVMMMDCCCEVRSEKKHGCGNAWHVAYLQSILERQLPEIYRKIQSLAEQTNLKQGWFSSSSENGENLYNNLFRLRVAEYHRQVAPSAALQDVRHYDHDSLVTVDILLSDCENFRGGNFQTLECDGKLQSLGLLKKTGSESGSGKRLEVGDVHRHNGIFQK